MLNVTCLGASGTVTGSKFLLQSDKTQVLVDCGLFQGPKRLRKLNWEDRVPVDRLDAIVLTHAHIDHTGYLPRVVRQGYKGPIYCSPATRSLLEVLLPDAAHLQEEDARYANKRGFSKHDPALPLFDKEDAARALERLRTIRFNHPEEVAHGVEVRLAPTGHILGAASLTFRVAGKTMVFSGDLGSYDHPFMVSPVELEEADYLFVESTYGNRRHKEGDTEEELAAIVHRTLERGGVVLIPAFAVGRTQLLLFHLRRLEDDGAIPVLPVYVDSPMAVKATHIYDKFNDEHRLDRNLQGDETEYPIETNDLRLTRSVAGSKAINDVKEGAIIISASGMVTGGRILHHMKKRLPDPANTVVFTGYQAQGTRGRRILNGEQEIKIHGRHWPVRAHIESLNTLSAHGDAEDILRWLGGFKAPPQRTFLIHGEPDALAAQQGLITEELGWDVHIPELEEELRLG